MRFADIVVFQKGVALGENFAFPSRLREKNR